MIFTVRDALREYGSLAHIAERVRSMIPQSSTAHCFSKELLLVHWQGNLLAN